jgi:YlmC/YmxH family sporulation protein
VVRASELRVKDVILLADGRRLGFALDLELDVEEGRVTALVLPGAARLWGILGRPEDRVIPWSSVRRVGVDVVLVDAPEGTATVGGETRRRG